MYVYMRLHIYIYIMFVVDPKKEEKYIFKTGRSTKRFVFFEFIYIVLTYVLHTCTFPAFYFRQRTYMAQGLINGIFNET